jgi:hypothetical protein
MTVRRHVLQKPALQAHECKHTCEKFAFIPLNEANHQTHLCLIVSLTIHHLPHHHHLPHQLPDAGLHSICKCSKPVQFHQDIATKNLIVHMDAFTVKMINETNSFASLCFISTQLQKEYHAAATVVFTSAVYNEVHRHEP